MYPTELFCNLKSLMHTLYAYNAIKVKFGIAIVNNTLMCYIDVHVIFQIYLERVYFLDVVDREAESLTKISLQFLHRCFLIILTIIIKDLYFTEHSPVAVYLNFHRFVDAENVLLWKFSSSRKF